MGPKTKKRVCIHVLQFLVIGVVMGITEDLLAIHFATDAKITWHVVKIAFIVAVPFAIISELVVDVKVFKKYFDNHNNSHSDSKNKQKMVK
ncbi:MAG: hypothetical protein ABIH88_03320 [Patescibacteria group bacterium]|nr:hypothetical protein [Patescibacteria group bacterium]